MAYIKIPSVDFSDIAIKDNSIDLSSLITWKGYTGMGVWFYYDLANTRDVLANAPSGSYEVGYLDVSQYAGKNISIKAAQLGALSGVSFFWNALVADNDMLPIDNFSGTNLYNVHNVVAYHNLSEEVDAELIARTATIYIPWNVKYLILTNSIATFARANVKVVVKE